MFASQLLLDYNSQPRFLNTTGQGSLPTKSKDDIYITSLSAMLEIFKSWKLDHWPNPQTSYKSDFYVTLFAEICWVS